MKKVLLAIIAALLVLFGGYALWSASRSSNLVATNPPSASTSTSPTPAPAPTPKSQYKDGTYTGAVGSAAPYGQVQVRATISGGRLTAVAILEKPQGPEETGIIAARAFPILVQEALVAQSAKVDIVSGATQDSEGFQTSLASALALAKN